MQKILFKATAEISVLTNGPFARISRMSAIEVAGAVEAEMAPSKKVVGQSMPAKRMQSITLLTVNNTSKKESERIRRIELCIRR